MVVTWCDLCFSALRMCPVSCCCCAGCWAMTRYRNQRRGYKNTPLHLSLHIFDQQLFLLHPLHGLDHFLQLRNDGFVQGLLNGVYKIAQRQFGQGFIEPPRFRCKFLALQLSACFRLFGSFIGSHLGILRGVHSQNFVVGHFVVRFVAHSGSSTGLMPLTLGSALTVELSRLGLLRCYDMTPKSIYARPLTTGYEFRNHGQPFAASLLPPVAYPVYSANSPRSRCPGKRPQIQNTAVSLLPPE